MNDKTIIPVSALLQILPADERKATAPGQAEESFDRHLRDEVGERDGPRPAPEQPALTRDPAPRAAPSEPAVTEPAPDEGATEATLAGAGEAADDAAAPAPQSTAKQTIDSDVAALMAPIDGQPRRQDLTSLIPNDLAGTDTEIDLEIGLDIKPETALETTPETAPETAPESDPETLLVAAPTLAGTAVLGPQTGLGLKAMRDLETLLSGGPKGPLAALAPAQATGNGKPQSGAATAPGLELAAGRLAMNGAGQQSANGADPFAILEQLATPAAEARSAAPAGPAAAQVRVESTPPQTPAGQAVVGEAAGGTIRLADAAPARLAHAAHTAQPPTRQIAVHIARALEGGNDRIRIQLNPAELGRVDVRLEVAHDGRVSAVVVAEKTETLDLLRRDAHSLEKALADAGLKADGGSLQFSLHGEQADQEFQAGGGSGDVAADDADGDLDTAALAAIDAGRWRAVDGVIDITV